MIERVNRHRRTVVSIIDAMDDRHLFAKHFRDAKSWQAWRAFLAALFGLPPTDAQCRVFTECTNRHHPSGNGYHEAWLCIGRRGGKSFMLALIAVYLACFKDWRAHLGP